MTVAEPSLRPYRISVAGWPEEVEKIWPVARTILDQKGVDAELVRAGPFGYYEFEPLIAARTHRGTLFYRNASVHHLPSIFEDLLSGRAESPLHLRSLPFAGVEKRLILRNCGLIDPVKEDEGAAHRLQRLEEVLEREPYQLMTEAEERGILDGATTAVFRNRSRDKEKIGRVICNAVDWSPSHIHGRLLLTADPLSIVEGVTILLHLVGAERATLCISEGLHAVRSNLEMWLKRIASKARFDFTISEVPPVLLAREAEALVSYLGGKQLMPWGTAEGHELVLGVEKVVSLTSLLQDSSVPKTHLVTIAEEDTPKFTVEVEEGKRLREILQSLYGAELPIIVQFPGATGRFMGRADLEMPIDRSCSAEIYLRDSFGIETIFRRLHYIHSQSCGRCLFCREGLYQIRTLLQDMTIGSCEEASLSLAKEIALELKGASLCAIGRDASTLILSALPFFLEGKGLSPSFGEGV